MKGDGVRKELMKTTDKIIKENKRLIKKLAKL